MSKFFFFGVRPCSSIYLEVEELQLKLLEKQFMTVCKVKI